MFCNWIGAQSIFYATTATATTTSTNGVDSDADTESTGKNFLTRVFGKVERQTLDRSGQRLIAAFSILFSLNIALGNVSLRHVSVNFNQVMRSLGPALTMAISILWLNKPISWARRYAILPVMVGVALACMGDLSYTAVGFFYTAACVVTATFKVVASGELLTGSLKLHPVDLLGHMYV